MRIEVKNVTKRFHAQYHEVIAVNNVSFVIEKGTFAVIRGSSGCGKTTLLNLIGMQESCDCGQILLDGVDITTLKEKEKLKYRREQIAMIFQFFNLMDILTLKENIVLPLKLAKKPIDEQLVQEYAQLFQLQEHLDHFPNEVSGGQKQRAAIIRALMMDCQLILADEPTGNLDQENSLEVMKLLTQINQKQGVTILMVTHDEKLASMADYQLIMSDGVINEVIRNEAML